MTQIEIFKQKFEKMVDNIPASIDSGAGYVVDEVYKILDSLEEDNLPAIEKKDLVEKAAKWILDNLDFFCYGDKYAVLEVMNKELGI